VKRREFITLLGGAAVAWPLAARAQQARLLTVGLLGTGASSTQSQWTAAFVQRLRELGWIEGQNVKVMSRSGDIPVEQPTKFNLVINLTTAKALGLSVPDTLLARADEVIE
jgi:putative ABC transport system substrate-binding protein